LALLAIIQADWKVFVCTVNLVGSVLGGICIGNDMGRLGGRFYRSVMARFILEWLVYRCSEIATLR
jgi:hypothetical protein